jgi:basic membrane protein A
VRRSRATTFAAIAFSSVIALAGCAKDSGGGTASGTCELAPKPAAAAATKSSTAAGSTKVDASGLKVGLAFDIGGRGDASFNDSSAAGLDKAKAEFGLKETKETTAAANEPEDAKQSRLRQMAQDGYNPIITVGFAYAESLAVVAKEFPNTKFAIIDDDSISEPNVTSLVFAEEQGSFLVGVAAALKTKSCHIGFVGGVNTPLIQKFEAGFAQGAKAASPNIKIESEYLTPAGDFTGFNDPAKGNAIAGGEIDRGADVVYHAAGASGNGVFEAVKAKNKLAIGVDSDQYNVKTVEASKDVIMTSMLKRVDVAVFEYIRAVASNDFTKLPKRFDLSVDGVGYATSGGKIDDIKDVLDAYAQQIIDGKIKVADKKTG